MSYLDSEIDTSIPGDVWRVEGINKDLTLLQHHCLSMLQRLVTLKNTHQTDSNDEAWMLGVLKKAIYSTLRDSIDANVGGEAKQLLKLEQPVK